MANSATHSVPPETYFLKKKKFGFLNTDMTPFFWPYTYRQRICWFKKHSYHNNDEVKPAPGVGEVLDKAEGQPLDGHLEGEYHGEDSVHVVQHVLQDRTFLQVGIFQSLQWSVRKV